MSDVRCAGKDERARAEQGPKPAQDEPRIPQMLQHLAQDQPAERSRTPRKLDLLDVADEDLGQSPPCDRSDVGDELDPAIRSAAAQREGKAPGRAGRAPELENRCARIDREGEDVVATAALEVPGFLGRIDGGTARSFVLGLR